MAAEDAAVEVTRGGLLAGFLAFSLPAVSAIAAEPASQDAPCQNQSDGRVCCQAAGFKVLVDKLIEARRDRDLCRLDLESVRSDLIAAKAVPAEKPVSFKPLVGYSLGVLGTALGLLPFVIPGADQSLRLSMAGVGAVLVGTGFVLSISLE